MVAPRYLSELQENAVWICMAGLWLLGGCAAWLFAVASPTQADISGSFLTLLAVLTASVSVSLRLPILSSPPTTSLFCEHLVWLLTGFATANWLGFFVVQSTTLIDAIPAVGTLCFAEVWFHSQVVKLGLLPWLRAGVSMLGNQSASVDNESYEPPSEYETGAAAQEPDGIVRRAVCGVDENGCGYMSGEIRVSLADGQKQETIVVGFCPAFESEPNLDFECDAEDISWELINCSPAGMRIGVRRSTADSAIDFELQWYAAQSELGETATPVATSSVLP